MKKTISLFATLALAIGLFAGCTSPNGASSLTPSQVATVGVVVSQAANVGAVGNRVSARYRGGECAMPCNRRECLRRCRD